jgi:hypothetical protein
VNAHLEATVVVVVAEGTWIARATVVLAGFDVDERVGDGLRSSESADG